MAYFTPEFISFFIELAPNNHKDWFDLNRSRYESQVREPFKLFVQEMIDKLAIKNKQFEGIEAKNCIFRINRDVRFSKNKEPYKLMVSAVISSGGKKSKAIDGVYFELTPEHVRVYGGVYEAEKEDLYTFREAIAENPKEFRKAIEDPTFKKTFGEILGTKNKIIPKEFKEAGETEPLIYNKQWYFYAEYPAELMLTDQLMSTIESCFEASKPVQAFFNKRLNH